MTTCEFWNNIRQIIQGDFSSEGLCALNKYAEDLINGKLLFKRFSSNEQHGCAAGGTAHVIATILACSKDSTDPELKGISDFKRDLKLGKIQTEIIETWAKRIGCWIPNVDISLRNGLGDYIAEGGEAKVYDNGSCLIKCIGLDYFILPALALDRITLHNTYFPETRLAVIGFGRDSDGLFKIIVEQPFIEGHRMTDVEIEKFVLNLGFELKNRRNWTFSTPSIYLSDMHDENVICSDKGTIFVLDCDIRINTPELKAGGIRIYSNDIEY